MINDRKQDWNASQFVESLNHNVSLPAVVLTAILLIHGETKVLQKRFFGSKKYLDISSIHGKFQKIPTRELDGYGTYPSYTPQPRRGLLSIAAIGSLNR